jgi:RNA recognition motif-containing protein
MSRVCILLLCTISVLARSGKSLCYGFVNFASAEAAKAAIDALNGMNHHVISLHILPVFVNAQFLPLSFSFSFSFSLSLGDGRC